VNVTSGAGRAPAGGIGRVPGATDWPTVRDSRAGVDGHCATDFDCSTVNLAAPSTWPPVVCAVARAYFSSSIGSSLKELRALDGRLAAAGHFRPLGDRPLVVLTALADKSQGMRREQGRRMQAAGQKAIWELHAAEIDGGENIEGCELIHSIALAVRQKIIAMDSKFRTSSTGETPVLRGLSAGQAFPPTLKV
jgi:hypothetical protein